MMLLLTSIVFLVGSAGLVITVMSLKEAPVAYEDDAGFHLANNGKTN